jgi:SSS family solute:Na+ symporter
MSFLTNVSMLAADAATTTADTVKDAVAKAGEVVEASGGFSTGAVIAFFAFLAVVITVSLLKSRGEKTGEDYFLAGRKLTWYLIGFSLIASNISTEQFVGMNSKAFSNWGMAVASYEWMSAIVLVFVALFFLPKFLKAGIYTMPEYLEYRYDKAARTTMAMFLMVLYVFAFLSSVLWSGSVFLTNYLDIGPMFQEWFDITDPVQATFYARIAGVWTIALIGAAYTVFGGLSAVVWADLIQGSALLIGGCIIAWIGLDLAGGEGGIAAGWDNIINDPACKQKLDVIRPWNDPHMPWVAIFIGGLWIPNIFYWGLNQFITQRTLGAKSVHEGQKGILFAAFMKLLLPFAVCIPGVVAFYFVTKGITNPDGATLFIDANDPDTTYPKFMQFVLTNQGWLMGLMFAAITGAVMSSFNSGVNSASTIFTMDIYKEYVNKNASGEKLLKVGRKASICFVLFACMWAPIIDKFQGVFKYIQEVWGLISPGIVAVFVVGMLSKRVPRFVGKYALWAGGVVYAFFRGMVIHLEGRFPEMNNWINAKSDLICSGKTEGMTGEQINEAAGYSADFPAWGHIFGTTFLHHMVATLAVLVIGMLIIGKLKPEKSEIIMPSNDEIDTSVKPSIYIISTIVVLATVAVYIYFWQIAQ